MVLVIRLLFELVALLNISLHLSIGANREHKLI